jgi:hypothetical protein
MARLLPWPLRHQRAQAIEAARRQKEVSRSSAAHARVIGRDIERMAEANHFAELIARQIMQGRGGRYQP